MLPAKQTNKTSITQQPTSLLEQCSQVVAGWITQEDLKRIPVDLYEPLQRRMDPARQRKVFGQVKKWDANGRLEWVHHWKDGKKHGEWKKWYTNGRLRLVTPWKDGQKQGEQKKWRTDGQLWWVESWNDGRIQGERQYYP